VPKLARNQARDRANLRRLRALGWSVHCLWECGVCKLNPRDLESRLAGIMSRQCRQNRWRC
jgi:G:T-mismatch repair DNA endonuclease (very short patch repair protein)